MTCVTPDFPRHQAKIRSAGFLKSFAPSRFSPDMPTIAMDDVRGFVLARRSTASPVGILMVELKTYNSDDLVTLLGLRDRAELFRRLKRGEIPGPAPIPGRAFIWYALIVDAYLLGGVDAAKSAQPLMTCDPTERYGADILVNILKLKNRQALFKRLERREIPEPSGRTGRSYYWCAYVVETFLVAGMAAAEAAQNAIGGQGQRPHRNRPQMSVPVRSSESQIILVEAPATVPHVNQALDRHALTEDPPDPALACHHDVRFDQPPLSGSEAAQVSPTSSRPIGRAADDHLAFCVTSAWGFPLSPGARFFARVFLELGKVAPDGPFTVRIADLDLIHRRGGGRSKGGADEDDDRQTNPAHLSPQGCNFRSILH